MCTIYLFLKIPNKVKVEIVKLHRNYLWHSAKERKGVDWISWKTVCKSKEQGGLGIKERGAFNKALLTKWLWIFIMEESAILKHILEAKYEILHERILFKRKQTAVNRKSVWWKDLIYLVEVMDDNAFGQMLLIKLGDGSKTPFWLGKLIG